MQLKKVEARQKTDSGRVKNENPWIIPGHKKPVNGPAKDAYSFELDEESQEIVIRLKYPEALPHRETSTGSGYSILPQETITIGELYESDLDRKVCVRFSYYTNNK